MCELAPAKTEAMKNCWAKIVTIFFLSWTSIGKTAIKTTTEQRWGNNKKKILKKSIL